MHKSFLLYVALTLIQQSSGLHGQIANTRSNRPSVLRDVSSNTIIETPQGLKIRANSTFTLTAPPVSSVDVGIIVNGITLIPGKEFNVTGTTVTFLRDLGGDAANTVQIKYQSQFASSLPSNSTLDSYTDLIARDALLRSALLEEPNGISGMRSRSGIYRSAPGASIQNKSAEFRSLRLLVDTLNAYPGKQGRSQSAPVLQGIEGIGDVSFKPDYSSILGVQSSDATRRLVDNHNMNAPASFRSLRMLQQQLEQTGAR